MKLIETINATTQTSVAANGRVLLGIVDKSICHCAFSYNGVDTITLKQSGYYLVQFKADLIATAADQAMSIGLVGNSVNLTVEASTQATASGDIISVSFFKIVKVGCDNLSLYFINTGTTATSITNVITSVIKIA